MCRIKAFLAACKGLGLLFYMLLGLRYGLELRALSLPSDPKALLTWALLTSSFKASLT